jgi:hypothetical protein
MLGSAGLHPLSTAVAGTLEGINVSALCVGSGADLIRVVPFAALSPTARGLEASEISDSRELSA